MRRLDALVMDFPDHYRLIGETDIDKTYEMTKKRLEAYCKKMSVHKSEAIRDAIWSLSETEKDRERK